MKRVLLESVHSRFFQGIAPVGFIDWKNHHQLVLLVNLRAHCVLAVMDANPQNRQFFASKYD